MSEYDFSSLQPYSAAYSAVRDLCNAMQSGEIRSGDNAVANWLSLAPDGWIARAAELLEALQQPEFDESDEPLSPGAAGLVIVTLFLTWEGVDVGKMYDEEFLTESAKAVFMLVLWEMARRSGAAAYELRGPLLDGDPHRENVAWQRRPSATAVDRVMEWRVRALFAN